MNKIESKKLVEAFKNGKKILIYDTETTGLDKVADVIVEYSAIVMERVNGKYQLTESFEQYIRPKFEMSEDVIRIHGITNEFLRDYPYEEEAYKNIKAFLNKHKDAIISGYNQYSYDDLMMYNLSLRQGDLISEHPSNYIDVYSVVKENIFEKKRNLSTMHALLCPNASNIQFHNSSDDIKATWNVAVALYKRLSKAENTVKEKVIPTAFHWYEPGAGKKYLFVTVKKSDGTYTKVYYDVYYKTWKSKEIDIESVDINDLEKKLDAERLNINSHPSGKLV